MKVRNIYFQESELILADRRADLAMLAGVIRDNLKAPKSSEKTRYKKNINIMCNNARLHNVTA